MDQSLLRRRRYTGGPGCTDCATVGAVTPSGKLLGRLPAEQQRAAGQRIGAGDPTARLP